MVFFALLVRFLPCPDALIGWILVSGHGIQEDAPADNDEDDGKNERSFPSLFCLPNNVLIFVVNDLVTVASDGNTIIDDWLKDVLVTKGVMKARGATLVVSSSFEVQAAD